MTPLVHTHGLLFTTWVLLFIVQTALVAQHRVAVHRRLGIAGSVSSAAAMIVVGTLTALQAGGARRGAGGSRSAGVSGHSADRHGLVRRLRRRRVLRLRRNREAHKRLMLLAYVSIIIAAVARLPGMLDPRPAGLLRARCCRSWLIGVVYDFVTRRRVHPAYIWGGSALILSVPLRLAISNTAAWKAFAASIVGLILTSCNRPGQNVPRIPTKTVRGSVHIDG